MNVIPTGQEQAKIDDLKAFIKTNGALENYKLSYNDTCLYFKSTRLMECLNFADNNEIYIYGV